MATKVANKDDDSAKARKNLNNWKFPKIPVHDLYNKQPFRFFPSFAIKDSEITVTSVSADTFETADLLGDSFLKGFVKNKHRFIHLGLVQVAVKPLVRDGLAAPVIVCLRDGRQCNNFKDSLLAVVESNMSQGPFYFDCFPSFSLPLNREVSDDVLTLSIKTSGVPVALTVRRVFKAMRDLSPDYLKEPTLLGKTTYFHVTSGSSATTQWDDVVLDDDSFYSDFYGRKVVKEFYLD